MQQKRAQIHIGLRTIKTAVAVIISMIIVDSYGATTSKLVFAMLGAMAAVQPTFKESLESCLSQIIGVQIGSFFGILMRNLPIPNFIAAGIGIVIVITLYNTLHLRYLHHTGHRTYDLRSGPSVGHRHRSDLGFFDQHSDLTI